MTISIIMGSQSDMATMQESINILKEFGVDYETNIISAHRTPDRLYQFCQEAKERGVKIIIAGAGGAAHLPGMTAAITEIPVLGVPVESKTLKGLDSLLSIAQMPYGIPVGTLAIGQAGAKNAALLAISILSLSDQDLSNKLIKFRKEQTENVALKPQEINL